MRNRPREARNGWRNLFVTTTAIVALVVSAFLGLVTAPRLRAQAPAGQSPAPQSPTVPQWQTDAGGKMAFDVASVKKNTSGPPGQGNPTHTTVPMDSSDTYFANGGLFSATNFPLSLYIAFAYKITPLQTLLLPSQLPKWATTDRFDVEAKASGQNPTKDQMRLMMQSLLAERFKLAVHWESREVPVYAFVLEKPGKTGPNLQPYSNSPPCAIPPTPSSQLPSPPGGSPSSCGAPTLLPPSAPGRMHMGSRNSSMGQIASYLGVLGRLDREPLDKTGLSGMFDFNIEWTPEFDGQPPPNFQPDLTGPTFLEALKEQLGLKLESTTGPVDVLVIDHVEEPTPN